jgi:DNA-binding HxlR family transcriptional regulator
LDQSVTPPILYEWAGRKSAKPVDPALEALVRDIIGKIADKWTMLILETLEAHGTLRFTELGHKVGDISQKMLTKTLRQMEADGLVTRKVHPVVPPHVDYALTDSVLCGLGLKPTMTTSSGPGRPSPPGKAQGNNRPDRRRTRRPIVSAGPRATMSFPRKREPLFGTRGPPSLGKPLSCRPGALSAQ